MKTKTITCEIIVEANTVQDAKSEIDQMTYDYFKHYEEGTKILDIKILEESK